MGTKFPFGKTFKKSSGGGWWRWQHNDEFMECFQTECLKMVKMVTYIVILLQLKII